MVTGGWSSTRRGTKTRRDEEASEAPHHFLIARQYLSIVYTERLAEAGIAGSVGSDDDGRSQILSGLPALTVEHVLLEQGEERFHGGAIRTCSDPARRPLATPVPGTSVASSLAPL